MMWGLIFGRSVSRTEARFLKFGCKITEKIRNLQTFPSIYFLKCLKVVPDSFFCSMQMRFVLD